MRMKQIGMCCVTKDRKTAYSGDKFECPICGAIIIKCNPNSYTPGDIDKYNQKIVVRMEE